MSALALNVLGDLEVIRDGQGLMLPPSKKTRALLAYLAVHARPFSREHLCDLFWELPDDPRGSLRWSLSKLRRLVDDPGRPRIIADRLTAALDTRDIEIDIATLHRLVRQNPEAASIEELEATAARYRGPFLEGLDLPNFHDFHSWCLAEREGALRAQILLLQALVDRLEDAPERALPHAHSLVRLSPFDEDARARLIRLLLALNRPRDAEQHFQLGMRLLMSALALNVLGDLEVIRDGQGLMLPPSKKTRALLAYLAVHARPFSREHLCDLFWELPDDPRGSLRWSLSKLRRLVDDPGRPRIIADRLTAALDTRDIEIDIATLHRLVRQNPEAASIEELEATAARYRGPFLEGLDLPNFHDFHSWCLAEREGALRAQILLLQALVDRLEDAPERALPHAHSLVRLSPFDEDARARLIRLLLALNRPRDAEQHFQLGMRLLKQAGITPQGVLLRARRTAPGHAIANEPADSERPLNDAAGANDPWASLLTRLDTSTREVLRWAAILTPCLDTPWLARVSGISAHQIGEAMEAAERLNLLEATERGLCFSHERVAQRLYDEISPARRQFMHHHVAEILARDNVLDLEHAADLAHHAQLSGDPGLAADALVTAGRLCLRFFANEQAQRLAQKGLAVVERLAGKRRICLLLELREIMLSAAPLADWETTASELVTLAEQALEHGALAHARLGYQLASQVLWAHGQWPGAHEKALQAERMTRSADDHEQVIAMAETAKCLAMLERDLDQAVIMLTEARELARQQRVTHPAIPMALGLLSYHDNRLDEAETHFKEARTLCKANGDRLCEFQANEYLMMLDIEQARYASAQGRCDSLVEIGEKLRDGSEAPFAHAAQALCHYALSDDTRPLDNALPTLRDADAKHRLSYLLTHAALLDVERDRPTEAAAHATEALDNARVLERATEQMLAHCVLAEAHRTQGDTAAHQQHAKAVATLEQAPVARWAWCRVAGLLPDQPAEDRT